MSIDVTVRYGVRDEAHSVKNQHLPSDFRKLEVAPHSINAHSVQKKRNNNM